MAKQDHNDIKKDVEKRLKFPGEETPEITSLTSITPPYAKVENDVGSEKINVESAAIIGAASDQVITGSPAAEYGSTGRFALDGTIAAAERIAREKYREMHPDEEE